jgi:GntR family transcriptional regulator
MMAAQVDLPKGWIERDSPWPLHFQLAALLEREVTSGRWEPGMRLPSEPALCRHYGLSRTTVRQALGRLEQEGLISRHKGQGTFVKESRPRSWLLQASEGFFHDELVRMGRTVTSTVLRLERATLPGWASDKLTLPAGSEGVMLERVRAVDGLVALYVVNYLPERLADAVLGIGDPNESLYERLAREEGITVAGGRRVLEAVQAEDKAASILGTERGAALALIESVSWDAQLRPFDCYRAWLRTDRMKVEVEVGTAMPTPLMPGLAVGAAIDARGD